MYANECSSCQGFLYDNKDRSVSRVQTVYTVFIYTSYLLSIKVDSQMFNVKRERNMVIDVDHHIMCHPSPGHVM